MLPQIHSEKSCKKEDFFRSFGCASTCSSNFKQSFNPSKHSDSFLSYSSSVFDESEDQSYIGTYKEKLSTLKTNIQHELASLKNMLADLTQEAPKAKKSTQLEAYARSLKEKRHQSELVITQILDLDQENSELRQQIKALKSKKQETELCKCLIF